DPLPVQFARFLRGAATFDFGTSYRHRRPVLDLVAERLPASLELTLAGMTLAIGLGVPGGVWCAVRRRGPLTRLLEGFATLGVALPTFVSGLLLMFIFGIMLGWLPTHGRGDVVTLPGGWTTGLATRNGLAALALPAMTLAFFQLALFLRVSRAQVAASLATPLVTAARARGLPRWAILRNHVLPNAAAPIITVIGLQAGAVFAFSAITEQVFQWPGLGLLFLQAIADVDVPVICGYLLLVAAMFVAVNLVVDVACCAVDPRRRLP
ncbi:MAG: ABC transporter permease, partial [Rhodospirillales bacterium]|nr:ABC transporter permease [Rhodospirillales bacterium]